MGISFKTSQLSRYQISAEKMDELPKTMKALRKETSSVGYNMNSNFPIPEPKDDEVLIKIDSVAICGSDIALYQWSQVAQVIATIPFIPGHEAVGTIVKLGPKATLKVGDRVGVENHFYCGDCYTCAENRGDICSKMNQYGHGRGTEHGGFSEYSIVSSKYCYVFKTDISFLSGVLLEPLGVAHNGVETIQVEGQDVLILGAGPIGLLAAQCAGAAGCKRIILADINSSRLELATNMNIKCPLVTLNLASQSLATEIMKLTNGEGVARLVEATGAPSMVNTCFSLLRKGARIVLIGLPKEAIHIEDPLPNVVFKSLTLTTVHGRKIFHTWEQCEALVKEGKVDPTLIVSHKFNIDEWQDAFDLLLTGKACKIVVKM